MQLNDFQINFQGNISDGQFLLRKNGYFDGIIKINDDNYDIVLGLYYPEKAIFIVQISSNTNLTFYTATRDATCYTGACYTEKCISYKGNAKNNGSCTITTQDVEELSTLVNMYKTRNKQKETSELKSKIVKAGININIFIRIKNLLTKKGLSEKNLNENSQSLIETIENLNSNIATKKRSPNK